MASSSGVYLADDLLAPSPSMPNSGAIRRKFKATLATMLAQTGAAKFLLGDLILLAPLPPQCNFTSYRIYMPNTDTGSGASVDLGDTQVLANAVTAISSGSVAIPAAGTTFTLTATASTASFTSTNAVLLVGDNLIVNYESLSGSTFVNCRTFANGGVIPNGAAIQQLGNTAAYQAASTAGMANLAGVITPDYSIVAANAVVTSTSVQNGTPVVMPSGFMTSTPKIGASGPTFGNQQPFYLMMRFHAAVTTLGTTTNAITGWIDYYMQGF